MPNPSGSVYFTGLFPRVVMHTKVYGVINSTFAIRIFILSLTYTTESSLWHFINFYNLPRKKSISSKLMAMEARIYALSDSRIQKHPSDIIGTYYHHQHVSASL